MITRLAVDKVKPCTGDGVGVVMQNKPSWYPLMDLDPLMDSLLESLMDPFMDPLMDFLILLLPS